MLHSETSA